MTFVIKVNKMNDNYANELFERFGDCLVYSRDGQDFVSFDDNTSDLDDVLSFCKYELGLKAEVTDDE